MVCDWPLVCHTRLLSPLWLEGNIAIFWRGVSDSSFSLHACQIFIVHSACVLVLCSKDIVEDKNRKDCKRKNEKLSFVFYHLVHLVLSGFLFICLLHVEILLLAISKSQRGFFWLFKVQITSS